MTGLAVHIPTLHTERLTLRAPTRGDFDAYAAFYLSPRSGASTLTRKAAWHAFSKEIADWCLGGIGHWTVERKDGAAVGFLGFSQPAHYPEPEIGWAMYEGHEGRGYATEAATAALTWARGRLASLVSYIAPGNARSIALAKRLGAARDSAAPLPDGTSADTCLVYRHWGSA